MSNTLSRAADLIEQKGWAQGSYARDKDNKHSLVLGEEAVCFCTLGAIIKVAGGHSRVVKRAVDELCKSERINDVPKWNDNSKQTKEQVVEALRKAAK